MELVNRPPKSMRTPRTEAAYVLTDLQEIFVKLANDSPTWAAEKDPNEVFVYVFRKCLHTENLDADGEAEDFFSQANDSGVDLIEMLWVAVYYCAEAVRRYQEKSENEAWTLVNSGFYWLGLLKAQLSENFNLRTISERQKNNGKKNYANRWGPRNETRDFALNLFNQGNWKSTADGVRRILPEVCKKAKEVGFTYAETNIERTISEWVANKK